MRRIVVAAVLFAVLAFAGSARPALAADDEIHWTMTGPNSVTVDWRGSSTTVRYGLTTVYTNTVAAVTPNPLPYSSAGPFHEARITPLAAGTTYHYSVGTGPDHTFHTLPPPSANFVVYAEGDIGDKVTYPRVALVQSLIGAAKPSFVLVVGDLTYGNDDGQPVVDQHFNDVMTWSQDAAYMPAWGNHEWSKSTDDFRNYKGRFDFPHPQTSPGAPAAGCCGEDWYWFDAGTTRFIAYPEPYSGAWSDWQTQAKALMDQAQADPNLRFIVTFGHRPAYSSGYHSGDSGLQAIMDALGDAHSKYVLNINGHSHDYERSFAQHGVIHITAGTGGSTLEEESGTCLWTGGCPAPSWSAFRAFHHATLRLSFTPSSIRAEAICGPAGDTGSNTNDIVCASGTTFDSFQIGTTLATDPAAAYIGGPRFAAVYPNPAPADFTVDYELGRSEPASLEVLDAAGRVVFARALDSGSGSRQLMVRRTTAMAPGVYWLRLSQAGQTSSKRVVFMN